MHQSSQNHRLTTHYNLQPDKNIADSAQQQEQSSISNMKKSIQIQDGNIALKHENKQVDFMEQHSKQALRNETGFQIKDESELMIQLPENVTNSSKIFFKPQQIKLSGQSKVEKKPLQAQKIDVTKFEDLNQIRKLRQFYEYFCKSSYIAGKHSTFERIKNSVNVMTIGKFVNFCRNFQINEKLNDLTHIFKYSTNYKSQMNFDQFLGALCTIANNCLTEKTHSQNQFLFSKDSSHVHYPAKNLKTQYSNQQDLELDQKSRQNLMKYLILKIGCGLDVKKEQIFKNSRKNGINAHENLIKPKPTSGYKFQIKALNGKNSEQTKEQIILRKKIKEEEKQKMREKKLKKARKQEQKFKYLNKIAISEKKVVKGGFMSVSIQTNKRSKATILSDTKKMIFEKSKSRLSPISMKPDTSLSRNHFQKIIESKGKHDFNIRHQTQMNTYNNNSFDDFNPEESLFKENSRHQTQSKMTSFRRNPSEKSSTYLTTSMNKEKMSREQPMKYRDKLQMNRVITQAKQDVDPKKKGQLKNAQKRKQGQKKIHSIRGQVVTKKNQIEIAGIMTREKETAEDIKVWLEELNQEDQYLNFIFKKKVESSELQRKRLARNQQN